MQAAKTFLQIYNKRIEDAFHDVFLIGSEIRRLAGEFPTEKAQYGGQTQENPAHVFELLAAAAWNAVPPLRDQHTFHYWTYSAAGTQKDSSPLTFAIQSKVPEFQAGDAPIVTGMDPRRLILARDFADMLCSVEGNPPQWWERQPWTNNEFRASLYDWAKRHLAWWKEMGSEEFQGHRWSAYNLRQRTIVKTYDMVSYLYRYMDGASSDLDTLFATVDRLGKVNLKEVQWASH
jgi:hypothetical protein